MRQRLFNYFNPMARLGIKDYSFYFPLLLSFLVAFFLELYVTFILNNPESVGLLAIFIFIALIIYCAFRDGVRGGLVATTVTIVYYIYIVITRDYQGRQLLIAIETILVLTILYVVMASIIGWLKETIDTLILREKIARKEAEEGQTRLKTVLQQLPVGVLLADSKGLKLEGNQRIKKMLGKKALPPAILKALMNGETVKAEEIQFTNKDQRKLFWRVKATPIKNRQKNVVAAVSTVDDITHEKEIEQRKDDFVHMASHELKTPITSLKLYLDLLSKKMKFSEDASVTKIVSTVKNQTDRLQKMVDDLLDVSRARTGKLFLNKEYFWLNELIEETIEVLQKTTSEHTIVFKQKTKVKVFGDGFRIYQVIANLLSNAIKYSSAGSKIILRLEKQTDKVVLSVQDFGLGIPKNQQKKIFGWLYQVNQSNEKKSPGLGLGLYISKEIIKKHKGKMWVESESGKGSTFYFSLPLKK